MDGHCHYLKASYSLHGAELNKLANLSAKHYVTRRLSEIIQRLSGTKQNEVEIIHYGSYICGRSET